MADKSPGRELAIETLIDMEPEGAFYRAARVLVRTELYESLRKIFLLP
jgi:hypothetical protein